MTKWQAFPEGTRVKHCSKGYEGWIDYPRLTELPSANDLNPDGRTRYRIRINGRASRELAAHHELQICQDTERILSSTSSLVTKMIERQGHDKMENDRLKAWNEIVPLPYTIWALSIYDPSNGGDPIKFVKNVERSEGYASYAIKDYFVRLDNILVVDKIPVAIVPSHNTGECNPTLLGLAKQLAEHGRIDATSSLERYQTIDSSRSLRQSNIPGNDIRRHLDSIRVKDSSVVTGQVVFLLDDVVTTGATFMACRKLLLDAGAVETICLALGRTKTRNSVRKSFSSGTGFGA